MQQHAVMGGMEKISEKVDLNLEVIQKYFQQALNVLLTKEKQLKAIKESVAESSKQLVMMAESAELRLNQVQEKGGNIHTFQEKGFKDLELDFIQEVKERQELLEEQQKMIERFFEKMEMKRRQFETNQRAVNDRLIEFCLEEVKVNLIKIQNGNRATELDKREEVLGRREKEIELRESVLSLKKEELIAKENLLDAREKMLDLEKELDSVKKSTGQSCGKLDSTNPTLSGELRKKNRKRFCNLEVKFSDTDCNSFSKRSCLGKISKSAEKVETSAHSHSESASGDAKDSDEMDENEVKPLASTREPVNDAEKILGLGVSKSDLYLGDKSISKPIDYLNHLMNDFEKHRSIECFAAGQTWAFCDDSKDNMPRSYVRILNVFGTSDADLHLYVYELQATTDSAYADGTEMREGWKEWIEAGLPVGCGYFTLARSSLLNANSFSHQVCCNNEMVPYMIYPAAGEIWALYKDWDVKTWASNLEHYRNCKYEIVQVLGIDHSIESIRVAYLDKVIGFLSLFKRRSQNDNNPFVIKERDILRFSHKLPSFTMTGNTAKGVPEGSFELDRKALPANL